MIASKTIKKDKLLLSNGTYLLSIDSIYESLDDNLRPKLAIKFRSDKGYSILKLDINDKLSSVIGNIGGLGDLPAGTHVKLTMLIGLNYQVTIKKNKIIKISKP